jgi:hypothetical protein
LIKLLILTFFKTFLNGRKFNQEIYFLFLCFKNRQSIGHGIPLVASSPIQNDISSLGPASQIEVQPVGLYQPNGITWKQMSDYALGNGPPSTDHGNPVINPAGRLNGNPNMVHQSYDHMMGFGSDEDDCFDMSDQNDNDSMSSADETRIQQL